ncbi:MAG: MltA domain-containing protein [Desmonostoc geniculatum HA4340-LM1]|jgi:membrane-bound lytic murein transglycosylase A|nr:MltA domain-containing protein [Desmonostoc geniculatum HA4340-LM1]
MKKIFAELVKFNNFLAISVIVVLSISLLRIQSLANPKLSPPECRVKKWDIPVSLTGEKQKPVLIQRKPITCCQGDASCLDEVIYGKIPDKKALLTAIDRSLQYLQTSNAVATYQKYPVAGINRVRVFKSLQRFREILLKTNSPTELHTAIEREFVYYQSVGKDRKGAVLFTAYYEPLYAASRFPTAEYRYPVYRLPPDFNSWSKPHPTRLQLEGADGLQGAKGKLRGLELFWFRDRLEPYMVQIQGSAKLQLTDGTQTSIGYAGNIAYNYKSIGRELANDGKLPLEGILC